MKTFLLIAALILFSVVSQAQYMIALTPDTTGTLSVTSTNTSVMHKFTSPRITSLMQYSLDVYVTASGTHATDSTHVSVWGSMDGTNYFQITTLGTPWLVGYGAYYATTYLLGSASAYTYTGYRLSSAGATAGWAWTPQLWMTWRYIQVRITQYKALSVLTVNRCYLHTFAK